MKGKVYLIGAGPGDYKLITMRGLEYLQQAEVVVYDRLADNRLLAYAPEDAEMIYVGKASANHTMKQEDINQLLVDKALEGKTVVRLKGGDPFVFGRGGEEALLLVENNVPFEIVPGISSSIAVPAYAGIPVTHRGIAASFAVVTGHEDPTKTNSSIYWQNLAKATDTLVFLMGVENLPYITKQLTEHGRAADTPAAVIRWGTKPEQRTLVTTLGSAAEEVAKHGLTADLIPAEFRAEGVVEAMKEHIQAGTRILLARAKEARNILPEELAKCGADVTIAEAYQTVIGSANGAELAEALRAGKIDWVTFTSSSTVTNLLGILGEDGAELIRQTKVACIGPITAATCVQHDIEPTVMADEYTIGGLVKKIEAYYHA